MVETGYATRDVARIAGLSESAVRALVRSGVLAPRRGARGALRFSLQDVVLLRTARGLRGRLSAQRLHRALRRLRRQLPQGRSLTGVQIGVEGDEVVVHDGETAWEPATGQLLLALDVRDVAQEVAPLARRQFRAADAGGAALSAAQWYALGCDLEAANPREAQRAYARALELDPRHADARVNLGRLLHEAGDARAAVAHYRAVLAVDGAAATLATAAFNLGVASEDLGDLGAARAAYEQALRLDAGHADAHYNLARLLEREGKRPGAVRHLREYKRLRATDAGQERSS
jgi:tetratricopeptide (TPR) repeat protein